MLNVLAACLVAQISSRAEAADLEFRRIQVEWMADSGAIHDFDQVLGRREAALLRSLGCEHGNCREVAEDTLAGMGNRAADAIFWGIRAKDPDVAQRCRRLMARLFSCRACAGRPVTLDGDGFLVWRCGTCLGAGSFLCEVVGYGRDCWMREADLFPPRFQ